MVRVIVLPGVDEKTTSTLKKMRPAPSYYVIMAASDQLMMLFSKVNCRPFAPCSSSPFPFSRSSYFPFSCSCSCSSLDVWHCGSLLRPHFLFFLSMYLSFFIYSVMLPTESFLPRLNSPRYLYIFLANSTRSSPTLVL